MKNSIINILASKKAELFIKNNSHLSPQDILLKYSGKIDLPIKEIAEQIECRKKAKKKLPSLSKHTLIYKKVSLEQASSEITAEYKSSRLTGRRIIDLTGGLGIDSIYFSKIFDEVVYCEQSKELTEIVKHNFKILDINNIQVKTGDGTEILKYYNDKHFDWIYVDPSRRNQSKRSVDIKYYSPNVKENFELLKSKTKNLLIKLAPAFDKTEAFKLFPELNEFSVVSVNNECKEVLLFFNFDQHHPRLQIKSAAVLNENAETQSFNANIDDVTARAFVESDENLYFYEPDAAIRKAGLSEVIADKFRMVFLNPLSDYMVSNKKKINFPGRKFRIEYSCNYNLKEIKKYLMQNGIVKANIGRSNFLMKPEEIKQTLKLQDGGEDCLFFSKNPEDKLLFMHCRRIDE
jgi:hypothetical protein